MDMLHGIGVDEMAKSYVLMTAMPPTIGHLQLIQFADLLADEGTVVIVSTQPHEPMVTERAASIRSALLRTGMKNVTVIHMSQAIEQNPTAPGFWETWRDLMLEYGVTADDLIVASEPYGKKVAEITGSTFYPYDIDRSIMNVKATPIRQDPITHFAGILPEFQQYLRTTVTIFGAESTGKTTLSRQLAERLNGWWLFEYARPYLEYTTNQITTDSMTAIWRGQAALQRQSANLYDRPFVIQDTDLYSTVGYWQFPHWQSQLGACPDRLVQDGQLLRSDLYIVTKSNIPFEPDPLRYGGDVREGSDEYWIDICERYRLPYVVLDESDRVARLDQAVKMATATALKKTQEIAYDRKGL
ncbi:MAG: hypothetical protein EON54_23260 [Alcaligenaceae bacterium]|nr:MAG: hypothetical protein EON54_23260 [Alcaligenaceae bacterium]